MEDTHRIPLLKFWGVLLVPLQGDITDGIAASLSDDVLAEIGQAGARAMIVDLTGVWVLDSHLCSVLSRLASSAALMGTRTVFSGMSPEIALTLQTMGAELPNVDSALTLESALELVGIRRERSLDQDGLGRDHDDSAFARVGADDPWD